MARVPVLGLCQKTQVYWHNTSVALQNYSNIMEASVSEWQFDSFFATFALGGKSIALCGHPGGTTCFLIE